MSKKISMEQLQQLKELVEQGDALAQFKTTLPRSKILLNNYKKYTEIFKESDALSVELLFTLAKKGPSIAKIIESYIRDYGVEKNAYENVKWYQKDAEKGFVMSQTSLGNCYYYGSGVEKNCKEAVKWYRKAAVQGCDEAQQLLGNCYFFWRWR